MSVSASWKEPAPGWIDNINGLTGLLIGAGKGVIRSMLCNRVYLADMMPCDIVVNATIAFAWVIGSKGPMKSAFLNVTSNKKNQISWGDMLEISKKHVYANPFSRKKFHKAKNDNEISLSTCYQNSIYLLSVFCFLIRHSLYIYLTNI